MATEKEFQIVNKNEIDQLLVKDVLERAARKAIGEKRRMQQLAIQMQESYSQALWDELDLQRV